MKPAPFAYFDPASVDEAVAFLGEHADEYCVLAGGQSLVPLLNMRLARPDYVVDINGLAELDFLRSAGGTLAIGSLTRHYVLGSDPTVAAHCPALAAAVHHIGHSGIRYRGTAGGSIAHADPAAELPAVAVALDMDVVLRSAGGTSRTVSARDFFVTHLTTCIEPGELVTELRVAVRPEVGSGSAVMEIGRRHGDFALVGVVVDVRMAAGAIALARIAAFGVDEVPRRLEDAERVLVGETPEAGLLEEAAQLAAGAVDPPSDMHAASWYRQRMTGVLVQRALDDALTEAGAAW